MAAALKREGGVKKRVTKKEKRKGLVCREVGLRDLKLRLKVTVGSSPATEISRFPYYLHAGKRYG